MQEYLGGGARQVVEDVRRGTATRVTSCGSCLSFAGQLPVIARYWCCAAVLEVWFSERSLLFITVTFIYRVLASSSRPDWIALPFSL